MVSWADATVNFPGFSAEDSAKIDKALEIAREMQAKAGPEHALRPRGEDVAAVLTAVHLDVESLLAALLSDSRVAELYPVTAVAETFGSTVANLVKDVTWLNKVNIYSLEMANQPNQSEILRRMLLSMTHDVRAVLIKLAFRIQRLRNLGKEATEIRGFIARETLDIYAPLANRLGVNQFKWELEDLAFRYLDPDNYFAIAKALSEKRIERESCIQAFLEQLREHLRAGGVEAKVYGRPKHIYSIWCKMRRKRQSVDELNDLLAVRAIVDTPATCYTVLGIAHGHWRYIPKEFDDYIANPKQNGYQSLHTVVLDEQGNRIEIQVRTQAMHEFAELGVAAHWRYKEGSKFNLETERNIASLRRILYDRDNGENLLDHFRTELFSDRVFVLTPAGKLIDLVKGATPLDFAYAVHTDIGHGCRGAKVNGRIQPLTYKLRSGEQVEIITQQNGAPNRNWLDASLGYLKTPRAISKVRAWFKQQRIGDNIAAGKQVLDKELKRVGQKSVDMADLAGHFKCADADQLYAALGRGDISRRQLAAALKTQETEPEPFALRLSPRPAAGRSEVTVAGVDNVMTTPAQCCMPVKGDDIVGFVSHKRGITIHRGDCENIRHLPAELHTQVLPAAWSEQQGAYTAPIQVRAFNARNLLNDVSQALAAFKVYITSAELKTFDDFSALLRLSIQVENTGQLNAVLARLGQLPGVLEVRRRG